MSKHTIAAEVAGRLYAAEAAIDAALSATATFAALLPAARADAYLSAVTGQRAFDGAAASIGALASARSHLVDTHNTLAALARRMGLAAVAIGPMDKPHDPEPTGCVPQATLTDTVNKPLPNTLKTC